jgi:hypothetical protein
MRRAEEVAKQLRARLSRLGLLPRGAAEAAFDLQSFLAAIAAGMFFNAARFARTDYDPRAANDAGTHVYRLLRHTKQGEGLPFEARGLRPASALGATKGVFLRAATRLCGWCLAGALLLLLPGTKAAVTSGSSNAVRRALTRATSFLLMSSADAPLQLRIHSSSVLWRVRPELVIFHRCQQGDEGWYEMQGVTAVTQEALAEAAPHFYRLRR